jgi:hypothetical protein
MTRKLFLPLALVGVTAMGIFAASGIGNATSERADLAGDRERVTIDVERGGPVPASAASAITSAKKKKVKIQHFFASDDVSVPTGGASELVRLACRGKAKVLSGDFISDGAIVQDWSAPASAKAWEFGFIDLSGDGGLANPGITCAKGVK